MHRPFSLNYGSQNCFRHHLKHFILGGIFNRDSAFEFNLCPFTEVSNLSELDMYFIKRKQLAEQKGSSFLHFPLVKIVSYSR